MHNDMIQESFLDTYNNLTLKTMMMLKWVNNHCANNGNAFNYKIIRAPKLRNIKNGYVYSEICDESRR